MPIFKVIHRSNSYIADTGMHKYHDDKALETVINYCQDSSKTGGMYVGGYGINIEHAAYEMDLLAWSYGADKGLRLRHWILSFTKDELRQFGSSIYSALNHIAKQAASYYSMEDYVIDSMMDEGDFRNYDVDLDEGTQNIYQRPVTLSLDSTISAYYGDVVENGNVDTDALKAFLEAYITVGEYNGIGGLAELLNHTAKDLDLQISKASYDDADGEITATISIGNQNYWMEEGSIEITIPVVKDAYTVRYDAFNATNATVTILHLDEDGNSTPANLPTDCKLYCVIYVRDDSLKTYADYAAYGEVAYRGEMTRSGSTGRYTISYPRLTGSFKMFAIAEGPGITLVQIDNP